VDLADERLPVGDGLIGVKGDAVADAGVVFAEDGFVIVCDFLGFLEVARQVEAQFLSPVQVLGGREFSHLPPVPFKQGFMKDQFIDQGVAGIFRRPLQVVPHTFGVRDNEPTLSSHPLVEFGFEFGLAVPVLQFFHGKVDRLMEGRFQHLDELLVRQWSADGRSTRINVGKFIKEFFQPGFKGGNGAGKLKMSRFINQDHRPGFILTVL
jgi:hypothetical protein